ncbi:MAG: tetratricopeptide repeat protein [Polyangia bacterium]
MNTRSLKGPRRLPVALLALLALLFTALPQLAHADNFEKLFRQGLTLYERKEYEPAIEAFLQAYEVRQLPRVLLNIAQVYRKIGRGNDALLYYERYLKAEPNPPPKIRADVEAYVQQVRALVNTPEVKEDLLRRQEPAPTGWDPDTGQMLAWYKKQYEASRKLYKKPWFWAVIGGAVAASVAIGVGVGVGVTQRNKIPEGITILNF